MRTLNPITAITAILWALAAVSAGRVIESSVLAVSLAAMSGLLDRALYLYLWLSVPSLIVVALFHGLEGGFEASARILIAAMASSGALAMTGLLELYRFLSWARIPAYWAILPAMIARQADIIGGMVPEALAAMRGRGVRGLGVLRRAPIPVLVNSYRSSMLVAEAVYYRLPVLYGRRGWSISFSLTDAIVALYLILSSAAVLAW